MDKIDELKKLATLQEEPNLVFLRELEKLNGKISSLKSILREENSKEHKTYESELETLVIGLQSLTEALQNKDMVVNIESNAKELKTIADTLEKILKTSSKDEVVNVNLVIE